MKATEWQVRLTRISSLRFQETRRLPQWLMRKRFTRNCSRFFRFLTNRAVKCQRSLRNSFSLPLSLMKS